MLEEYDGSLIVSAHGSAGNPGQQSLSNWFKIEKYDNYYKIVFCPTVCDLCRPLCGDIGIEFSEPETLAVTAEMETQTARRRVEMIAAHFSAPNNISATAVATHVFPLVVSDPSSPPLSLQNEKSPTLGFKTPVPNSPAMIRAGEIQSSLGTEFPSCIKMMVKSQVSCGFWLGLPLSFCRSFLPKEDTTFILEDENGEQCEVKYIAYKSG